MTSPHMNRAWGVARAFLSEKSSGPVVFAFLSGLFLLSTVSLGRGAETDRETKAGRKPAESSVPAAISSSVSSSTKLAPWQEKFTLGPGDVLSIGLYGQPDSTIPDLFIGPDGRISYLEADDIMAADLTVDQLRSELEKVLSKFHLAPRVIINPQVYKSKKYYVLGGVVLRGVFSLDKPVTIVEAVARAKGFPIGGEAGVLRPMVNFGRSFLIRKTEDAKFAKVPVDFEALFLNGELAQNQNLAPDDYLYFPPIENQDVYALGAVAGPGAAAFGKGMTVLQVIARRGGFTDDAFRTRLLVIRGSLTRPETFVVNGSDVLSAKSNDMELQPGDIIYVAKKPWAKAEELLNLAIGGFVDAATVTWTGLNVGPLIK